MRRIGCASSRLRLLALALACVAVWPGAAPAGEKPKDAVVAGTDGKALDDAVRSYADGKFWGAVLAAKGGKILIAKGYGMADFMSVPATARSLYDIGSTSKQFTAAAILRLAMQKRLTLDDPISKHLDGVPADKSKVTIRQLLHHVSGVSYPADFERLDTSKRDPTVARLLAAPLAFEPGTKFEYSNVGYFLLAAVVDRAAGKGKSFEDYLRGELFKPAGLTDTGFVDGVGLDKTRATARVATIGGVEHRTTAVDYPWNWGQRGATGVVTTALDLYAWDRALRGDKILDKTAKEALYEPGLENYACGWVVEKTERGTTCVHHAGATRGYASEFSRWLEEDAVVVVLTKDQPTAEGLEKRLSELLFAPR